MHQDGLIHISALSDTFVKDPRDVVKAGDIVKVKVLEVDVARKRIALTRRLDDTPAKPPAARASVMSAAMGRVRAAMQAARTAGRTGARAMAAVPPRPRPGQQRLGRGLRPRQAQLRTVFPVTLDSWRGLVDFPRDCAHLRLREASGHPCCWGGP